ncbi:MAG: NFACT family protein, partial [Firmicutes bacterium]|nr:NFACT family protein [Bacillota bacterium]
KPESNINSQFLITLKKHLEGAILQTISQYQTDRVIIFNFSTNDFIDGPTEKQLIFEAMGKHSNLLLVQNGIIIDTFKKMFFEEGRQLLPMAQFEFFPTTKSSFMNIDYQTVFSSKDLVDRYMGVSPFLAKYLINHQANLSSIKAQPTRNLTEHKDYVFDIFESNIEKKYYSTLSEMMDDQPKLINISKTSHELFINKQSRKFRKKSEQLSDMLEDATLSLKNKEKGDLIYQSGLLMHEKLSSIEVNNTMLSLDPTKTLNENAQLFYKTYQRAKRAIEHIQDQNRQNNELIALFDEFKTYLDLSKGENLKDFELELVPYGFKGIKTKPSHKKQNKKPNYLKLTDDDVFYYIGKNSLQNEYVTHQIGKKDNYWFHVKDFPGAHVVVDAPKLDEVIIRKASMLAAYFSSLKYSSSIPVDYTQIKYIKRIPGMPGYHVNYKNHQTMFIDIDEQKVMSYLKNV